MKFWYQRTLTKYPPYIPQIVSPRFGDAQKRIYNQKTMRVDWKPLGVSNCLLEKYIFSSTASAQHDHDCSMLIIFQGVQPITGDDISVHYLDIPSDVNIDC